MSSSSAKDVVAMGGLGDVSSKVTRVVLVGRTGIDSALRADSSLMLVRVHSALDAIGEVAFPVSESELSPVVVLAREVQAELCGASQSSAAGGRLGEFVESLRGLCPGVRVVAMSDGGPLPFSVLFDAIVPSEAHAESVRSLLAVPNQVPVPSQVAVPNQVAVAKAASVVDPVFEPKVESLAGQEPPLVEVRRPETSPRAGACGDTALVALVLKGLDPLPAAVEILRDRCGDVSIQFHRSREGSSARGVAVSWDGGELGCLTSERTPVSVLAGHAKWLAGWLRLHGQHTQLRDAAFRDHLTGAWNRRYFERFLGAAVDQARSQRQQLSVMVIDIDNFKQYNDQHGHEAGDKILCEIVGLLTSVIRPSDRVCRLGGDEFVVVFHDPEGPRQEGSKHPADVHQIARRFQDQVSHHRFPRLSDRSAGTLTVSGGLATFPWDGSTTDQLLARADELAMQGKRQGKNMITFGPGPGGPG
ncbi:MAG: GGDEF domain-containing protein [Phycisphaerales bacterium]